MAKELRELLDRIEGFGYIKGAQSLRASVSNLESTGEIPISVANPDQRMLTPYELALYINQQVGKDIPGNTSLEALVPYSPRTLEPIPVEVDEKSERAAQPWLEFIEQLDPRQKAYIGRVLDTARGKIGFRSPDRLKRVEFFRTTSPAELSEKYRLNEDHITFLLTSFKLGSADENKR